MHRRNVVVSSSYDVVVLLPRAISQKIFRGLFVLKKVLEIWPVAPFKG